MMVLTRSYRLSVAHQIPEEFVGQDCARVHGHEFKVEVSMRAESHQAAKSPHARDILDAVVEKEILAPFQNSYVNTQLIQTTGEVLALEFLSRLRASAIGENVMGVQLVETRNNRFQGLGSPPVDKT
jgi:6-pyruvoyl-tetrahydropterin synthase